MKPGAPIHPVQPVTTVRHLDGHGSHRAPGFFATGTAVRRLTDEHKLPETCPKPTFTLGLAGSYPATAGAPGEIHPRARSNRLML